MAKRIVSAEHIVLYRDAQYNTFPSAIKRPDGSVLVGFRQAPDRRAVYGGHQHIDPASRAVTVASADGRIWNGTSKPLFDHFFYGVQDPCLNALADGTIVATFFMWKVFEKGELPERPRDRTVYGQWGARKAGAYAIRSFDGGATWDEPTLFSIPDVAIRGTGVETEDGRLLVPIYRWTENGYEVLVTATVDLGRTWEIEAAIPGCDGYDFLEPLLHRTPSGKLVLFIRTRSANKAPADPESSPLYTTESLDGGKTWSRPVSRAFWSPSPFHALTLQDGSTLLTYGHRYKPYGIRAVLLDAECEQWGEAEEIALRDDGLGMDIGYTSSVQLNDGRVLVTYYYYDTDGVRYIAGTLCELS